MAKSHRNSILPIINSPIACDGNTSFLLSPSSSEMYSDSGLIPLSNITTFRKGEGKLKDAVAIEEGTTNIVLNPEIFSSGWGPYNNGNDGSFITEFKTEGIRLINRQSWCGCYKAITLPSIGEYTLSVYVKPISRTDPGMVMQLYVNGVIGDTASSADWSPEKINKWQRITLNINATSTTGTLYLICYGGADAPAYKISCEYTMPQIEKKSFATSFVSGTRTSGILTYNIGLITPWTISFWVKPQVPDNYTVSVNWIFTDSPYSGSFIMWKRTTEDYYRIRMPGGDYTFATGEISFQKWSHVSITTNGTTTEIYLDGTYKGVITGAISVTTISLGSTPDPGNNLFSEIKIDKIYKNSDEIMQMYLSNAPTYLPNNSASFC